MSFRSDLIARLRQDLLGPRKGVSEILEAYSPRDEYLTGLLSPDRKDEVALDAQELENQEPDTELEQTHGDFDLSGGNWKPYAQDVSPSLDSSVVPRSLGISFVVSVPTGQSPRLKICATWANYRLSYESIDSETGTAHRQWQRYPDYFLTQDWIELEQARLKLNENVDQGKTHSGALIDIRVSPWSVPHTEAERASHAYFKVSVFMTNQRVSENPKYPLPEEYLYQSQLRVVCAPNTQLQAMERTRIQDWQDDPDSMAAEEASLALLYRERLAYARGHLCGAVWGAIDPEQVWGNVTETPFQSIDLQQLPSQEQSLFQRCHVRSEWLPMYQVNAPSMDWPDAQAAPELFAENLAKLWQPESLYRALSPLVDGYSHWIEQVRNQADELLSKHQPIAYKHISECEAQTQRMQAGLNTLMSDEKARLAFCFANQAMHLQAHWDKRRERNEKPGQLKWRPFQLAFMLLNIEAFAHENSSDRDLCDLLWFPTGGGKTEAYLALMAYVMGIRRLKYGHSGAGTSILSRYTLRLLTIQQYRRALAMVTACEALRVWGLHEIGAQVGWRPEGCTINKSFLWGESRFSAGLWVGSSVTANQLESIPMFQQSKLVIGALDQLRGLDKRYQGSNPVVLAALQKYKSYNHFETSGEAAQVTHCPFCQTILALPDGPEHDDEFQGLMPGEYELFVPSQIALSETAGVPVSTKIAEGVTAVSVNYFSDSQVLALHISVRSDAKLSAAAFDRWFYQMLPDVDILSARPSRPGYHILQIENRQKNNIDVDFDVYCPRPDCHLNQFAWAEAVPLSRGMSKTSDKIWMKMKGAGVANSAALPHLGERNWQKVPLWNRREGSQMVGNRIPIPAYTIDDQVYRHCPSLIIATVDKFARLAYEPRAATIFGNVEQYNGRSGYYRRFCVSGSTFTESECVEFEKPKNFNIGVASFRPPELILQDELHLIEGPLGSMTGLYETVIDELCSFRNAVGESIRPKYIASSATVRQSATQVQALYNRQLSQFPAWALLSQDRFFAKESEVHPAEATQPGRLYLGILTPGRGSLPPVTRLWAILLQATHEMIESDPDLSRYTAQERDLFATLVGYFNAVKELAGVQGLLRQEVYERIQYLAGDSTRNFQNAIELSARCNSTDLPAMLQRLDQKYPESIDTVLATSMFGTGVDVDRLGLMIVHGQPKTTAAYIQASGRVGRREGALVLTLFRSSRPRDLDHYEHFIGYHRALYRHVEPITVAPYSPRARERALGPLTVALLRQARTIRGLAVQEDWRYQQRLKGAKQVAGAKAMAQFRRDEIIEAIAKLLEHRAQSQPASRRPSPDDVYTEILSELDRWYAMAEHAHSDDEQGDTLLYYESTLNRLHEHPLILGDAHALHQRLAVAFPQSPHSLRDVEETTTFGV